MDTTKLTSTFLLFFAIFLNLMEKGLSIYCYKCNSHIHGDECTNLEHIKKERRQLYVKDCDHERHSSQFNRTFSQCRKMVQEISYEVRVIRQCASGDMDTKCMVKTGSKNITVEYCECKSKLCNSSNSITSNHIASVITGALTSLLITVLS